MRAASQAGLYFGALVLALALPDIAGAAGSRDGRATRARYIRWLVDHAECSPEQAALTYKFRCSLLHEGSAQSKGIPRIAFIEPTSGALELHNVSTVVDGARVDWLSIPLFVEEIAIAVEAWLSNVENLPAVQHNMAKFVQRYPEGLAPHVVGAPVIA